MKQTTVEWLEDNLIGNPFSEKDFAHNVNVFKKAKEMEKEQIQDAFDIGFCEGFDFGYRGFDPTYESGEMYYDKTYGDK